MKQRASGILLHITALPSRFGIGDFGGEAYKFVDFLRDSGQKWWQILPINPTTPKSRNSPYSVISSFALNGLLISPEKLREYALLGEEDVEAAPDFNRSKVEFIKVIRYKRKIFRKAFENFKVKPDEAYNIFCEENKYWLDDYALFTTLKDKFSPLSWLQWPVEYRDRHPEALSKTRKECFEEVNFAKFLQYAAYRQYSEIKDYAGKNNVGIFGDLPIYVDLEGSDCWANPQIFKFDSEKKPLFIAGVPPDYFSRTGQLWKNPVYDWEYLKKNNFVWWKERIKHNLKLFGLLRLDHFIGFIKYWEVAAGEKTAARGSYVPAYGEELLSLVKKELKKLPVVAEDLGLVTQEVEDARRRLGLPGMKILQFAFGDDFPKSPYLPMYYSKNSVVYSGTHDNNTVKGWYMNEAPKESKQRLQKYIGREINESNVHWEIIRLGMLSAANIAIFPMQDILGLGSEARFNLPSTRRNNWSWRLLENQANGQLQSQLAEYVKLSARQPDPK